MPHEKRPDDAETEIAPATTEERIGDAKGDFPIGGVLAFLAVAVLGALIVLGVKRGARGDGDPAAVPDIAALRAEVEASRNELNAERAALGKGPLGSGAESAGDIAARLRRDADSLAGVAVELRDAIAAKNADLLQANAKLLESEKLRQTLAVEIGRLNGDLQRARADGGAAAALREDLAAARARADSLAGELADARAQATAQAKQAATGVSPEAYADLKRQLEETKRAKEFFEKRVKSGESGAPDEDAVE
jgi:chromosome segregation ATPase